MTARTKRHHSHPPHVSHELPAHARRYLDKRFDAMVVKVLPGEHYVSGERQEMLVTILGSCVAACIHDPVAKVGGMNHFMLPEAFDGEWGHASAGMRYGNVAMERLINDVLARGGARHRLEIKVFGGANVLKGLSNIGHRNADFVEAYLAAENLPITAYHLRGSQPRRVHYFPFSGRVMLLELPRNDRYTVAREETSYNSRIQAKPVDGSVELF
ncbi:putative chemoreceptor glutamine deamidase CheD [Bradyrhizobium sp. SSBR45G]|uniref:chemoreceptor glutamine deamidase CheD n=1 Tax=unclassified Bradyrhizobium TaxID=2631580 RepID=UPI0023429963|nr:MULTISPECIES: chemoreceptor glutamine deamidase CheD [unclassified Bradyrhizobium]GLH81190.1 putative chemoreceptor glutamine deamidase CheD [Bradyrhizobium sp. SSBR45G]GLH88591.1 putative chemoreceptor glutamine deamidase CheD [Bradyrhizobium sp. SSBR45R]